MPARLCGAAVLILLLADGATIWHAFGRADPITLSDALAHYRSEAAAAGRTNPSIAVADIAPQAGGSSGPAGATGRAASAASNGPTGSNQATAGAPSTGHPAMGPGRGNPIPRPRPGVYAFDTSGSEHVTVLGGQTHTYPPVTYMTETSTACGDDARWSPLQQRWDEYDYCDAGRALLLHQFTTFHDFFAQPDTKSYTCTNTFMRPPGDQAGVVSRGQCTANGASETTTVRTIGTEVLTVAGMSVPTLHIRAEQQMSGSVAGSRTIDAWWSFGENGLIKFVSATNAQAQTSFGFTGYTEHVVLQLRSPNPVQ